MPRMGTSIRMDSEVLSWIDDKVEECIFASRTNAFEYAIRQLMKGERRQRDNITT